MSLTRNAFYSPQEIRDEVALVLESAKQKQEHIDYLSFVPDGEPTLDVNLGKTIQLLKEFAIPIAVITNASLMTDSDVRTELMLADWVSVKVDVLDPDIWKRIDRPHGHLNHDAILEGIENFAKDYKGTLVTETMLVKGINDNTNNLKQVAQYIRRLNPEKACLLVPIRPPAEEHVSAPDKHKLISAFKIFSELIPDTLVLSNETEDSFGLSDSAEKELVSIMAVHPMRRKSIDEFLNRTGESWDVIHKLLAQQIIKEVFYEDEYYYVKNN